jgi:hypothetical protein
VTPRTSPPPWLALLQAEFTALLRAPLDASSGTFTSHAAGYPARLRATNEDFRLELHHRQYWVRLFETAQTLLPRTARALGFFRFNELVLAHLSRHPPRHADLSRCIEGVGVGLTAALHGSDAGPAPSFALSAPTLPAPVGPLAPFLTTSRSPPLALAQCLAFDLAERHAFVSPWVEPWSPTSHEIQRLGASVLVTCPSLRVLREDFGAVAGSNEHALRRRKTPRFYGCARTQTSVTTRRVAPLFAEMLCLARTEPLVAIAAALPRSPWASSHPNLATSVEAFIREAIALGWWVGLKPPGAARAS